MEIKKKSKVPKFLIVWFEVPSKQTHIRQASAQNNAEGND